MDSGWELEGVCICELVGWGEVGVNGAREKEEERH